jgi:cysteine synthase
VNPFVYHQLYRSSNKIKEILDFLDSNKSIIELFDISNNLSQSRKLQYKSLYQGIGNTKCYEAMLPNNNRIFVKMEYANSMGNSHYSRYWLAYLYIAEASGIIIPGETNIIDVSSGSAGIALALATKYLGYKCTIIVPDCLPESRVLPMIANGAELVRVHGYIDKCIVKLLELVDENRFFPTNHSEEKSDLITKVFKRIAIEFSDEHGAPDYAVLGLGNGSTTFAIFDYLSSLNCQSVKVSYHPELSREQLIYGLYGPNVKLRHIELSEKLTDFKFYTNDIILDEINDYFKYDTEIINLGPSSKYGIAISYNLSKTVSNKCFFSIGYDKNDRY